MIELMTTKEVAEYLSINEKMVYSLISEKNLPASKITGKWLFPKHLVDQWIEARTINYPNLLNRLPPYEGLLIITGSNDILLDKIINLYNQIHDNHIAVFGNLGSMGGLRALRQNRCHIATSHLVQENGGDYNFEFAAQEFSAMPAVINFCRRSQGILLAAGNPHQIRSIADLGRPNIRIVNRPLGTGTRLLLDRELQKLDLKGDKIEGYTTERHSHLLVGLEILAGRADAGIGIQAVAGLLGLDFVPLCWERYDFMITKDRFFDEGIQRFLSILHENEVKQIAAGFDGYDLSLAGKMIFPGE